VDPVKVVAVPTPVWRVAAVQAAYTLMDRDATIDRVAVLAAAAAREGAQLVVFPEAFVLGTPIWIAPTLAVGDGWIAIMRHLARENRMFVIAVNPVLHADQIPAGFPARDRLLAPGYLERNGPWLEQGNTVIVAPDGTVLAGTVLAGPVREREETLVLDLDLRAVAIARRYLDPVGHYNRPDIFRLCVDTSPRPAVTEIPLDHLRSPS
jgi:predicted amidohydrolase